MFVWFCLVVSQRHVDDGPSLRPCRRKFSLIVLAKKIVVKELRKKKMKTKRNTKTSQKTMFRKTSHKLRRFGVRKKTCHNFLVLEENTDKLES